MTVAVLPPFLRKEIRGLFATWSICVGAIACTAIVGRDLRPIGVAVYFLGAVAIGALSIGQEHNSRTLTLLLSQPVARWQILLQKAGVLAMMLGVLGISASGNVSALVAERAIGDGSPNWWAAMLFVPLLSGFFLAPWLTLLCRSPLAGAVFALAVPGTIWIAGDIAAAMVYGGELSQTAGARAFTYDLFWRGTLLTSVVAAIGSWRAFIRLEAVDSRGLSIRFPAWLRGRTISSDTSATMVPGFTRRRAFWMLTLKELRLQQLTFAISGLYIVAWIGLMQVTAVSISTRTTLLYMATLLHAGAVPVLAGALASAEERQLGTLGWHTLLPMAAWKQWAAKASVAVGIALSLALGAPVLLSRLATSQELRSDISAIVPPTYAFAVVAIVIAALYVSSLCASGLRALLIALPIGVVLSEFATLSYGRWYRMFGEALHDALTYPGRMNQLFLYQLAVPIAWLLGYAAALALLLRLGLINHRSAERGPRRIARQLALLTAMLTVSAATISGVSLFARAEYDRLARIAGRVHVSGVVVDVKERPVKKYTVVIFGEGGRDWSGRFDRGAFVRPDENGEFDIAQVPAGLYRLVAVREMDSKVLDERESLERLKRLSAPMTFLGGGSKHVTLPLSDF